MFVCRFTDSESHRRNALLRMEPALPEGPRPPRAGRRVPCRAPDTDPSLGRAPEEIARRGSRGPQNGGLGRSCARTELGVWVPVPRSGGLRSACLVGGWVAGWLGGWVAGWCGGWLGGGLAGMLAGLLAGLLAGRLAGWLSGCLLAQHAGSRRAGTSTSADGLARALKASSWPCVVPRDTIS